MRSRSLFLLSLLTIFGMLLSACSSGNSSVSSQTTYQISPSFREFYEKLGGENVLGPAISKSFNLDAYECQYTVGALICVNPQVTDASRLFLYPLGDSMNVREDPAKSPAQSGTLTVDGYTVYDEFIALYNQIGPQYVGKPLTQAHINYSLQRIEQYFENVGFYRKFNDPAGSVHLLAYGAYHCATDCRYTPLVEASILNVSKAGQDQPLLAGLSELGDTSILGNPITQPYIASDGMEEQVYENAVVYAPANNLSSARLRPLSILLNIPRSDPGPQKYNSSDGMVFYATNGSNGYHVPLVFDQFIAAHGGKDYSGEPIDEVFQYQDNVYRQCFENYCLDYITSVNGDKTISLAPLGQDYLQQITGSSGGTAQPVVLSSKNVDLQVNQQSDEVSASDQQKIDILVTQKGNQQPATNVSATLTMDLPDGTRFTTDFPATGLDGRSSVLIPAQKKIPNGTILVYQVCLNGIAGDAVCVSNSYLIWSVQ
jgi:hypothetical protein